MSTIAFVVLQSLVGRRKTRRFTLEFGSEVQDPFCVERFPIAEKADRSTFLHPVIRYFRGLKLLGEHHMLENLYGEWKGPQLHREPLQEFLRRCMELRAMASAS